jgi:ParB family chromosome partitioning protein
VQVEIGSIQIRRRVRKELQELDQLADSMNRFGQLHPITITRRKTLIAGQRRLEAARILGWTTIEATILAPDTRAARLELELEENLQRCPLKREELESALCRLEKFKHPGFFRRIWHAVTGFFIKIFGIEV